MPLAVVGSNVVIEVNGRKVRGRQYPWGVAEGTCRVGMTRLSLLCGLYHFKGNGGVPLQKCEAMHGPAAGRSPSKIERPT